MGRPVGGNAKVSLQRVALLPERGSCNEFAKLLGLSATTLRQWCLLHKLPNLLVRGVFIIERERFRDWLIETERVET